MTQKTFCDICGKEVSASRITNITTIEWWSPHWPDTHLCGDCTKKVADFIEREKENQK